MKTLRTYGKPPFSVAVIHGGPGAPGEMAPVARELARTRGVLEPLQTESSIIGQVQELKRVLEENAGLPVTLIGFSWGAILSFIFTAENPSMVKRLILVGSGVFEEKYAAGIGRTRISRLSPEEQREMEMLLVRLNDPREEEKDIIFARVGEYLARSDSYDPYPVPEEVIAYQYDIFTSVWREAGALRKRGDLLAMGRRIHCPVVAIHGDFDPHPADGVRLPLSRVLCDFRFILLERCGHRPWIERAARERFFVILQAELEKDSDGDISPAK
jgi:pimeloyl-ACP methyl ester carboxylesterase